MAKTKLHVDDKEISSSRKISEVEDDFIYRTGKIGKQWGLGDPAGKVWATLLFAKKPISQRDISTRTGYSLSLISPTLKILVNLNMARIVKGESKERCYILTSTLNDAFSGLLKRFQEYDIRPLVSKLDEINKVHPDNDNVSRSLKEYVHLEKSIRLFQKIIVADKEKVKKIEKMLD